MTILTPPADFIPSTFTLTPVANTQSGGRSPFDGTEQTLEQPGQRWAARLTFQGLTQSEWRPILAFVANLGGRAGRFTWSPPLPRQGVATGGVVGAAAQTGKTLATTGWTPSAIVALPGDLIGWTDPGGRPALHMVTATCSADGAGVATLSIAPPIRRSPNAAAALVVSGPVAVWMLTQDRNPLDIAQGLMAGASLDIEEALV